MCSVVIALSRSLACSRSTIALLLGSTLIAFGNLKAQSCDATIGGVRSASQVQLALDNARDRDLDGKITLCLNGLSTTINRGESINILRPNIRIQGLPNKINIISTVYGWGIKANAADNLSLHNFSLRSESSGSSIEIYNSKNIEISQLGFTLTKSGSGIRIESSTVRSISDIKFTIPDQEKGYSGISVGFDSQVGVIERIKSDSLGVGVGAGYIIDLLSVWATKVDRISDIYAERAHTILLIGTAGDVALVERMYGYKIMRQMIDVWEGRATLIQDLKLDNSDYEPDAVAITMSWGSRIDTAKLISVYLPYVEYYGGIVELFQGSSIGELSQSRLDLKRSSHGAKAVGVYYESFIEKISDLIVRAGCGGNAVGIFLQDNSRVDEVLNFKYLAHDFDSNFSAIELRENSQIKLIKGFSIRADYSDRYSIVHPVILLWDSSTITLLENGSLITPLGVGQISPPSQVLQTNSVKYKKVPSGDATGDGVVNLDDLNAVRNNIGLQSCYSPIDVTLDGIVDASDVELVSSRFATR